MQYGGSTKRRKEINNSLTPEFLLDLVINQGKTRSDICKLTGFSPSTIQKRLTKLGLVTRYDRTDLAGYKIGKLTVLYKTDKYFTLNRPLWTY